MRIKMLGMLAMVAPVLAVACGGEEPPPPQPPPPPPPVAAAPPASTTAEAPPAPAPKPSLQDLIGATMKAQGDAFNGHDAAKFAAGFTTDAVTTDYGFGENKGRDEIQKMIQGFMDMSSDAKGMPAHAWIKGNVAVIDLVTGGTMTGDWMGMKASKKPFGHHMLMVTTFNDDGLISAQRVYGDGPGLMAQLKGAKDAPEVPAMPASTDMHFAKNSPDEDKLVDWAKSFNDAFNKGDPKAVTAMVAPDAEMTFQFMGGKVIKAGKDLDKFSADFMKAIPKAQWTVSNAWGIDGFAIVERSYTGKMTGKMGPVPPTNKDVTVHVAEIFQPTADGKVAKGWAFGNMGELMPMPKMKDEKKEAPKDAKEGKDKGADKGAAAPKKDEKKEDKK